MEFNFLKSLESDDIFISYSREDGSAYLKGLDAALSARGFSCFTDKRGTDANRLPPKTLFRKIRLCKTLVLLATPSALRKPENISPEVVEFADANGTARIVCVSFDRDAEFSDWSKTPWYTYVEGKAREREDPNTLKTGEPSTSVVETIVAASDYMKSKDRLRKYRNRTVAVLASLVILSGAAAGIAWYQLRRAATATTKANEETSRAAQATQQAQTALTQSVTAQAEAFVARLGADIAKADAAEQRRLAKIASDNAAEKTKLANAATLKAQTAEKQAAAEQVRADREQTIAEVRSRANHSQTLLRQRPDEVQGSLKLAVDAMSESSRINLHAIEADTALRNGLAVLPRLRDSTEYFSASDEAMALSPDGKYFAILDGSEVKVYEPGKTTPIWNHECECGSVALASGLNYVAASLNGGVRIFDLRDASKSHTLAISGSPKKLALSPSGHYLAFYDGVGEDLGYHSTMTVIDARTGSVIKSFKDPSDEASETETAAKPVTRDPAEKKPETSKGSAGDIASGSCGNLNMVIKDIAFSATGNLAIGGKYNSPEGGRFAGRVVIWILNHGGNDGRAEETLDANSFDDVEVVPQYLEVSAVAPGTNGSYFATDKAVWKKPPGQLTYEPVARILHPGNVSMSLIQRMAFTSDGRGLLLFRHTSPGSDDVNGKDNDALELWDATGLLTLSEIFHSVAVTNLGFSPGGRFVATTTERPSEDMASDPAQEPRLRRTRAYLVEEGIEAKNKEVQEASNEEVIYVSPDGGQFVTTADNAVQVWDTWEPNRKIAPFADTLKSVEGVAVSHGGKFLALTGEARETHGQRVAFYQAEGMSYVKANVLGQNNKVQQMFLSSNGQRLALLYHDDTNFVRIIDVNNGQEIMTEAIKDLGDVQQISFSQNGRYLVVVDRNDGAPRTRLIDISDGRLATLLDNTPVSALAFSPDEKYLGVGAEEGILYVFETNIPQAQKNSEGSKNELKEEIARLPHNGKVTAIAFSDDNKYVATASAQAITQGLVQDESYPVRIWLLQSRDLIDKARRRLTVCPNQDPGAARLLTSVWCQKPQ